MTSTWLAPARATISDLPPTQRGLATALRVVHHVSTTLAVAQAEQTERGAAQRALTAVELLCGSACECLATVAPLPTAGLPRGSAGLPIPATAGTLRSFDALLGDCLELAVVVLDNEEEPLDLAQVQDIGAAIGLLDRARAVCSGIDPVLVRESGVDL